MTSDVSSDFRLTGEDILSWQEEARAHRERAISLRAEADEEERRAASLDMRVHKARELVALINGVSPPVLVASEGPSAPTLSPADEHRRLRRGSWPEAVQRWINEAARGLSRTDLREKIAADPVLSVKFAESDKGYYHALARLKSSKMIVLHEGRYYSPTALDDHMKAVASGEVVEPPALQHRSSSMGEAVMDIVAAKPGIRGGEIVSFLRSEPEFAESLKRQNSGAYNVMARLAVRQLIIRENGVCRPGPKMPPRDPDSKWSRKVADAIADDQGGLLLN